MIPTLEEIEVQRIHDDKDSLKKEKKRLVNVDMNPMVDLAFLLLTFFMLATTFSKPQAMELLVPAKPKAADVEKEMSVKESKTLNLVLLKDKIMWYKGITDPETNRISYEGNALVDLLHMQNAEVEGLVILIKPCKESNYGNLVRTLDIINEVGAKRYAISELNDFDKELNISNTEENEVY